MSEPVALPRPDPTRPLRITVVVDSMDSGGAERQAVMLAAGLSRPSQVKVELLALRGLDYTNSSSDALAAECQRQGIAWRTGPLTLDYAAHLWQRWVPAIGDALRAGAPDVLLPYTARPNFYCGLLWRQAGARTCVWNQRDAGLYRPPARWERLAAAGTPWFVANSEASEDFLAQTLGVPATRRVRVANGVFVPPPAASRQVWRSRLAIAEDAFAACMVANLTETKDHATLIRAWGLVVSQHRGATPPVLVLVGYPGSMAKNLKALVQQIGLVREVRFAGQVDDVPGVLGAMDLCVHSSRSEGLPNGVLEAMAVGLPVAATDLPGIRLALGPGGETWLAPAGDAAALAAVISRFVADPALGRREAQRNRQRVAEAFSPSAMIARSTDVLRQALACPRPWQALGRVCAVPGAVGAAVQLSTLVRAARSRADALHRPWR